MQASSLDRRRVGDSPWSQRRTPGSRPATSQGRVVGGRRHMWGQREPLGGGCVCPGGGGEGRSQAQLCSIPGLSTSGHGVGLPQVCVCGRGASCVHPKQGLGSISHQPPGGVGLGLAVLKPQPSVVPPGLDTEASGLGNARGALLTLQPGPSRWAPRPAMAAGDKSSCSPDIGLAPTHWPLACKHEPGCPPPRVGPGYVGASD